MSHGAQMLRGAVQAALHVPRTWWPEARLCGAAAARTLLRAQCRPRHVRQRYAAVEAVPRQADVASALHPLPPAYQDHRRHATVAHGCEQTIAAWSASGQTQPAHTMGGAQPTPLVLQAHNLYVRCRCRELHRLHAAQRGESAVQQLPAALQPKLAAVKQSGQGKARRAWTKWGLR